MVRTRIVETVCDKCEEQGVKRPAVKTEHLSINGVRALLDLCEEHETELLTPLLTLMMTRGVTESGRAVGETKSLETCPTCGKTFYGRQSLGMHVARTHIRPRQRN